MENLINMNIDEKTLNENFTKNEINIIKQLQNVGINGGNPPQMTAQARTILMEKMFDINNKQKINKDIKEMTDIERSEYKRELKERLRNKINFKANSRQSKLTQSTFTEKKSVNINNSSSTNNSNSNSNNNSNNIDLTNIDSFKNAVGKLINTNTNPEANRRFQELFGANNLEDLLKDDKMKEIMDKNGFSELLGKINSPSINNKKNNKNNKKKKKSKKPQSVIKNIDNDEEKEELLDDYVEDLV
jgi:hypothetical protein